MGEAERPRLFLLGARGILHLSRARIQRVSVPRYPPALAGAWRLEKGGVSLFSINGNNFLDVDLSDLRGKIDFMRGSLTRQKYEQMLYRTFGEVGRSARSMISKEVTEDYAVTQEWVRSQIQNYRLTFGGGFPVTCSIPIKGTKGGIGRRFKLKRPARDGKRGKIFTQIVKTNESLLPQTMSNQGGNPPFIAGGMVFTRRKNSRLPIVRVVGLGVPQMPLNRSGPDIQDALLKKASERLDHHFLRMMSGEW